MKYAILQGRNLKAQRLRKMVIARRNPAVIKIIGSGPPSLPRPKGIAELLAFGNPRNPLFDAGDRFCPFLKGLLVLTLGSSGSGFAGSGSGLGGSPGAGAGVVGGGFQMFGLLQKSLSLHTERRVQCPMLNSKLWQDRPCT